MNRFAFSRGQGLAYADLPPTLQPFAIASAAPHDNHLRAAGYSGLIYALLVGAVAATSVFAPKGIAGPVKPPPHERIWVIEPLRTVPVVIPPAVTSSSNGGTADSSTSAQATVPVSDPDLAPDGLSLENHALDTPAVVRTVNLPPGLSKPTTNIGTGPIVHDFSMTGLQVLQRVDPTYPEMARRAHVQGMVVLLMTVDEAGVPTQVQVLEGHPALQDSASRAARQWRFVPAQLDGRAVAASFRLTLKFSMK